MGRGVCRYLRVSFLDKPRFARYMQDYLQSRFWQPPRLLEDYEIPHADARPSARDGVRLPYLSLGWLAFVWRWVAPLTSSTMP